MSRKKAFWLPEEARKARKGEVDKNLVLYMSPKGYIRRYICAEYEAKFYRAVFSGTT